VTNELAAVQLLELERGRNGPGRSSS